MQILNKILLAGYIQQCWNNNPSYQVGFLPGIQIRFVNRELLRFIIIIQLTEQTWVQGEKSMMSMDVRKHIWEKSVWDFLFLDGILLAT